MLAKCYSIGCKFKNIETGHVIKVIEIRGIKYFEDMSYGDLFLYVNEDLYEEIK